MGTSSKVRGYPRTRFQLIDQTYIPEVDVNAVNTKAAIIMVAYTSDKGSEGWEMIRGLKNFTTTKGGINFEKHGQAQLTIAEVLRNSGLIFGKRMVSDDATLANVTVRARVVESNDVSYVYTYLTSAENAQSMTEAVNSGRGDFDYNDLEATDFPLFTIAAAGRGASALSFRINPEYANGRGTTSFAQARSSRVLRYSIEIYENNELLESIVFSMNPDYIVNNVSQSIQKKINNESGQIQCQQFTDGIYAFARCLLKTATIDGESTDMENLMTMDMIFGLDRRGGTTLGGIVGRAVDPDDNTDEWNANIPSDISDYVVDVSKDDGIALPNGSYGAMGAVPSENPEEVKKLLLGAWGKNVRSNQYDPIIYDLDAYKPDAIFDANYDVAVKNAIIDVCDFRGDVVFFVDLGTEGNRYLEDIVEAADEISKSRFCAVYHNYCNVVSPYDKKEITVTLPYLLASRFVHHLDGGAGRPFAGIANDMTFPEIITGSLNFIPYVTPAGDEKQILANNAINYISYYDGLAVLETTYVNYEEYTQLSFLHNILAIQEVIKAIRSRCPKTRYTFLDNDGEDLENYIEDAKAVINQYQSNFKEIDIQYMEDEDFVLNNIFYATIMVRFHNFIQEEFFKVICIN